MRKSTILLPLLVLLGCRSPSTPPPKSFPCVDGWPSDPQATPAASLGIAPVVAWIAAAGSDFLPFSRPGIALSGDNIVLSSADWVNALNRRTGSPAWQYQNLASHQYYSSPVADQSGNTYVTRDSAIDVIDSSGKGRTLIGFTGTDGPQNTEFGVFSAEAILNPDGILFHQSNEGTLRAVKATDGSELWAIKQAPSSPSAGAGKVIVAVPDLRDALTGAILGQFVGPKGTAITVDSDQGTAVSFSGFLGHQADDLSIPKITLVKLSTCGKVEWNVTTSGYYPMVDAIGPGGIAYITALAGDAHNPERPNQITAIRPDGTRGATIETVGRVLAIGADETVYVMDCSANSRHPTDLVAYTLDLVEKGRLTIPGNCALTNAVLTDDGMLYFGRHATPAATEIVAVQTTSPGLAHSAWPSWRHDNRATSWLAP